MSLTVSGVDEVKWSSIVLEAKRAARQYYSAHGIAPTLRGLFYILVSMGLVPNTKKAYQYLSSLLAAERYVGRFPWHLIRDETRAFRWGEVGQRVVDAEQMVSELSKLTQEDKERLLREYLSYRYRVQISKWEGQRHSVLVVVEKEAQFDVIDKMLNKDLEWDVNVTTSRGFESATAAKEVSAWISSVIRRDRTPVLIFVFDWDPSGEYASIFDLMFRSLMLLVGDDERHELIKRWSKSKSLDEKGKIVSELASKFGVVYEKALLTYDQVKKYNLPPEPQDENVKKKLQKDPRARMFYERYGFIGQVEIDAMISLYYDETVKILDQTIKKYFDEKVYEGVKRKEEELRRKALELLK